MPFFHWFDRGKLIDSVVSLEESESSDTIFIVEIDEIFAENIMWAIRISFCILTVLFFLGLHFFLFLCFGSGLFLLGSMVIVAVCTLNTCMGQLFAVFVHLGISLGEVHQIETNVDSSNKLLWVLLNGKDFWCSLILPKHHRVWVHLCIVLII